jgi:hypothetical protein
MEEIKVDSLAHENQILYSFVRDFFKITHGYGGNENLLVKRAEEIVREREVQKFPELNNSPIGIA